MAVLEFGAADDQPAVGEIGHRIEAVDRQTGVAVDHDALGGRGAQSRRKSCDHRRQAEGNRAGNRADVPLS